jgi:uncharacterized protein YbjQ (UPF0145 family)
MSAPPKPWRRRAISYVEGEELNGKGVGRGLLVCYNYHMENKMVEHTMVTTAFELNGYHVVKNLGVAKGIVVRSRSIFGSIGASLQTLVGGNISLFTTLCEKTRSDAFDLMLEHAGDMGANAVIGARYDATEIMGGVTEVLAYGTAVVVESNK